MTTRDYTLDRIAWYRTEADRCEAIGAHRLAGWWRAKADQLTRSVPA